jgi:hypothetical protein
MKTCNIDTCGNIDENLPEVRGPGLQHDLEVWLPGLKPTALRIQ